MRAYEIEANGRKYTRNRKFLCRSKTTLQENDYNTDEESLASEIEDNENEKTSAPET